MRHPVLVKSGHDDGNIKYVTPERKDKIKQEGNSLNELRQNSPAGDIWSGMVTPSPSGHMWSGVVTRGPSGHMWSGVVTPGPSDHMCSGVVT